MPHACPKKHHLLSHYVPMGILGHSLTLYNRTLRLKHSLQALMPPNHLLSVTTASTKLHQQDADIKKPDSTPSSNMPTINTIAPRSEKTPIPGNPRRNKHQDILGHTRQHLGHGVKSESYKFAEWKFRRMRFNSYSAYFR